MNSGRVAPLNPATMNATGNQAASVPGLMNIHTQSARMPPPLPMHQAGYLPTERLIDETEFSKRILECIVDKEEVNIDAEAMRCDGYPLLTLLACHAS